MKKVNPRFSVIIPLYNKELYINRAIKSVLNQTYEDYELIVVNDGSTDDSLQVAKSFKLDKIIFVNKTNGGESSARNEGIKKSSGEYICFLDADDEYLENHLNTLNKLINNYPKHDFFSTNYFNKFPGKEKEIIAIDKYEEEGIISDYFLECRGIPLVTSNTACIKKEILDELGVFDNDLKFGPDLEMWFRIALNYKLVFSNIPTAIYYRDADNRIMSDYNNFNDAIISKMTTYLGHTKYPKSAKLYIESNIKKQIKYHLLKGNNRLVRNRLKLYKNNFIDIKKFYFFKLLSYIPLSRFLRIMSK